MKKQLLILLITFIFIIVTIIFFQEYSYRKNTQLKVFQRCLERAPVDLPWVDLQQNVVPRCLEISK